MDINLISRHFDSIGATLLVDPDGRRRPRFGRSGRDYQLDIEEGKNERFVLSIRESAIPRYEFLLLEKRPKMRHLLLLARQLETGEKRKFLCGHDERHWFIAGLPEGKGITGIDGAMQALKPDAAIARQIRSGVKPKNLHRRRNDGFIRQGEWFFLPEPSYRPANPLLILRGEPLARSGGKSHMTAELYRTGGTMVYVSRHAPHGLTEGEYRDLIKRRPGAESWNWTIMRRDPVVFVRGTVRHPDHKTVTLPFWHRVLLNGEWNDGVVAFLD